MCRWQLFRRVLGRQYGGGFRPGFSDDTGSECTGETLRRSRSRWIPSGETICSTFFVKFLKEWCLLKAIFVLKTIFHLFILFSFRIYLLIYSFTILTLINSLKEFTYRPTESFEKFDCICKLGRELIDFHDFYVTDCDAFAFTAHLRQALLGRCFAGAVRTRMYGRERFPLPVLQFLVISHTNSIFQTIPGKNLG